MNEVWSMYAKISFWSCGSLARDLHAAFDACQLAPIAHAIPKRKSPSLKSPTLIHGRSYALQLLSRLKILRVSTGPQFTPYAPPLWLRLASATLRSAIGSIAAASAPPLA